MVPFSRRRLHDVMMMLLLLCPQRDSCVNACVGGGGGKGREVMCGRLILWLLFTLHRVFTLHRLRPGGQFMADRPLSLLLRLHSGCSWVWHSKGQCSSERQGRNERSGADLAQRVFLQQTSSSCSVAVLFSHMWLGQMGWSFYLSLWLVQDWLWPSG